MNRLTCVALFFCFSSCTCADEHGPWDLVEPYGDAGVDVSESVDSTFTLDLADDVPPPPDEWVPDEVVTDVPMSHALNERTSLTVDANGTLFLGYHACHNARCSNPSLVIARRQRGGEWTHETVKSQRGTFGIAVSQPEHPIAAFLDPTDNTFKVARRDAPNRYDIRTLGVRRTGVSDGLDLTPDAGRMFVTFANERGDPVSLFVHAQGSWRALENLDIADASAAYERGLGADDEGNMYLVHRNGSFGSPWGLARYSLAEGHWGERAYFQSSALRPSSLVVKRDGELCLASDIFNSELVVTCGDMDNLERSRWDLGEDVALGSGGYSSMLEGSDGSLFVAYPTNFNTELRLARKNPSDVWDVQTVFNKNAYGVSTVIDQRDLLVISYYTCGSATCSLEVISRPQ